MDTLTHALSGALLARAVAPGPAAVLPVGRRVLIGGLAAAFPDIDVVASWLSPLAYLYHHRGITHSLVMLPLWTLLLAWLMTLIWRKGPDWKAYAPVIALSILIHIAGDWITSFGTMIFAPFSDYRHGLGTTFIIDLWFSGIILAALVASLFWRRSRVPAILGLAVLAAYVGLQYAALQRAVAFGEQYAAAQALTGVKVSALPRPVSPFNWMVIIESEEGYRYSHVNLVRREPRAPRWDDGFIARLDQVYRPLNQAEWAFDFRKGAGSQRAIARAVFDHPEFAFFRWFAAYPALHEVQMDSQGICVWFKDLRFLTPGRGSFPFIFGMCGEGSSRMKPYRLDDGVKVPVY